MYVCAAGATIRDGKLARRLQRRGAHDGQIVPREVCPCCMY